MSAPSLRTRIRNGTLIMLALIVLLGIYTLPRLYSLGTAIRNTLYRNYLSIESAKHMHAALSRLELAERDGKAQQQLPRDRDDFMHWMNVENNDFTEVGEPELAHDIQARATKLFGEVAV